MIFPSKFSIFNKDLFVKISCLFEPASPATTQFFISDTFLISDVQEWQLLLQPKPMNDYD